MDVADVLSCHGATAIAVGGGGGWLVMVFGVRDRYLCIISFKSTFEVF